MDRLGIGLVSLRAQPLTRARQLPTGSPHCGLLLRWASPG